MRLTLFGTVFDSAFYILLPLPRCGSVVLDFMMRFNRSVVVSNVLTVLLDAARHDKFGGFKVDPESIKQVFMPADDSESTTKGTFYQEILLLNVYTYSSRRWTFSNCIPYLLIKQLNPVSHIFLSCVFVAVVVLFNRTKFSFKNYYRESSTLLFLST